MGHSVYIEMENILEIPLLAFSPKFLHNIASLFIAYILHFCL